ncbi:MAG: DUF3179 domain-containing protein [Dehalococcoidia bacterium]|nr:DUF3179 domain-containing protein [Dehalococcoidia bacterium]
MTITRISVLTLTLLLMVVVACSSEDEAEPSQAEPRAASAQPTTAPEPTNPPVAAAAPTQTPSPTAAPEPEEQDLEIVTLLPFDAIPAVLDPVFISADEADAKLTELLKDRSRRDADAALLASGSDPDDALVLGVSIEGDSRAYYIPTLSKIEIVNDTVGGQPLAVTW